MDIYGEGQLDGQTFLIVVVKVSVFVCLTACLTACLANCSLPFPLSSRPIAP